MNYFTYKDVYIEDGLRILEVNILPEKYCNFDCIFCPVGRSKNKTDDQYIFNGTSDSIKNLREIINMNKVDIVFINSKGEALLNKDIDNIINFIKALNIRVKLLSNGYILNKYKDIANLCDEVIGEIKITDEELFQKVQRPLTGYTLEKYINSMATFKEQYSGFFILEITILKGYNNDNDSVSKLQKIIRQISPDRIIVKTENDERFVKKLGISQESLNSISHQLKYFAES